MFLRKEFDNYYLITKEEQLLREVYLSFERKGNSKMIFIENKSCVKITILNSLKNKPPLLNAQRKSELELICVKANAYRKI